MAKVADGRLLRIGELARATGLPIKTIRFWSDQGLVPPAGRTPSGYRLYDSAAQLRLGLVRTLRDLGIDLATIQRVVRHEVTTSQVAETHAAAMDARIRTLRLQRSVLRTVADRGTTTPEEIELMHQLARLSDAERRNLINEFIDDTFSDLDLGPDFLPQMRAAMPELPEDPAQEQIDAWVELGELVQDSDFRASLRRAAVEQTRAIAEVGQPSPEAHQAMAELLQERVDAATNAGIAPDSAEAAPVVDELVAAYAQHTGQNDGPEFRAWLLRLMESSSDARYERYWHLLGVINGWPAASGVTSAAEWLITALRNG